MISQQGLSDRFEIQELMASYCDAIDARDWNALDTMFTADAVIDYTETGGARGGLTQMKVYLDRAVEQFTGMQHMVGLPVIKITGDTATARTPLFNPMVIEREGAPHVFFFGLWYCDTLVRTETGWRIQIRHETYSYSHNVPADFKPVDV